MARKRKPVCDRCKWWYEAGDKCYHPGAKEIARMYPVAMRVRIHFGGHCPWREELAEGETPPWLMPPEEGE